jgi:hypothetical protein
MALVGQHFPLLEVKPYCIFLNIQTGLPLTGKPVFFCHLEIVPNKSNKIMNHILLNNWSWRWQDNFIQK